MASKNHAPRKFTKHNGQGYAGHGFPTEAAVTGDEMRIDLSRLVDLAKRGAATFDRDHCIEALAFIRRFEAQLLEDLPL